jgi:hypothetical protein
VCLNANKIEPNQRRVRDFPRACTLAASSMASGSSTSLKERYYPLQPVGIRGMSDKTVESSYRVITPF